MKIFYFNISSVAQTHFQEQFIIFYISNSQGQQPSGTTVLRQQPLKDLQIQSFQ